MDPPCGLQGLNSGQAWWKAHMLSHLTGATCSAGRPDKGELVSAKVQAVI